MSITKNNYETYIIDYLDRNLNPLEVAELLLFLEQHPDIKTECEGIDEIFLESAAQEQFNLKDKLKRQDVIANDSKSLNYNELLIAKIENDLTKKESDQLDLLLIQNPLLKKELDYFNKTKLIADFSIHFEYKNALKKHSKIIPLFYKLTAAAALITGIIVFSFMFSNHKNQSKEVAAFTKKTTPKVNLKVKTEEQIYSVEKSKQALVLKNKISTVNQSKQPLQVKATPVTNNQLVADVKDSISKLPILLSQELKPEPKPNIGIDFILETKTTNSNDPKPSDFLSLKEIITKKIKRASKNNVDKEKEAPIEPDKSKITGWDVAAFCANILSKSSGKKIKIENKYDANGQLIQYAIASNNFEFSKSR